MDKFYTTFDAAQLCHVSPGSVIRWVKEGKLVATTTPGGHRRIAARDLTFFLRQYQMPIPSELEDETLKMLLITENEAMGKTLRKWISDIYPEAEMEEARDYFVAGWKAARFRPDLIVLDLKASQTEVFKVCELMKAFFEYKSTPLLVLVSSPSTGVQRKIHSLGKSAWLSKPLERNQLAQKLNLLLRKSSEKRKTGS